jgi:AAA domain
VRDVAIDTVHVESWPQAAELAAQVNSGQLAHYHTLFIDSITAASRLSLKHAETQPECISRGGAHNTRAAYGLHARQLLDWLHGLQRMRGTNVIFAAILESIKDDFGRIEHRLQLEGQRVPLELPGIVDEIITMSWVDFGDKQPVRAFICTQPNPYGYPAKDRSGRLEQIEEPNLGRLITKLVSEKE